jgi:hypothetical protein
MCEIQKKENFSDTLKMSYIRKSVYVIQNSAHRVQNKEKVFKEQHISFPALVVEHIIANLPSNAELLRLACVCKRWRDLARAAFYRISSCVERHDLRTLWFTLNKRSCNIAMLTALERGWVHCARKKFTGAFRIGGRHSANKLMRAALSAPVDRRYAVMKFLCEHFVTHDYYSLACQFNERVDVEWLISVCDASLFRLLYRGMETCKGTWILDKKRNQGSEFVKHQEILQCDARNRLQKMHVILRELVQNPKFSHVSDWVKL